jgi:hypothetical protein
MQIQPPLPNMKLKKYLDLHSTQLNSIILYFSYPPGYAFIFELKKKKNIITNTINYTDKEKRKHTYFDFLLIIIIT